MGMQLKPAECQLIEQQVDNAYIPSNTRELSQVDRYCLFADLLPYYQELCRLDSSAAHALCTVMASTINHNKMKEIASLLQHEDIYRGLSKITDTYFSRHNNRKPRKARSAITPILDRLCDAFFLLNPVNMPMPRLFRLLHGGQLTNNVPVGTHSYHSKTVEGYSVLRSRRHHHNRLQAYHLPVGAKVPVKAGHRRGKGTLPPIDPDTGKEYWMTEEARDLGHMCSPLYIFHAQAWALRKYADLLVSAGYEACPFTDKFHRLRMTVEHMRWANDGYKDSPRYLHLAEEALRYVSKQDMSDTKTLPPSYKAYSLPMYFFLLDKGKVIKAMLTSPTQRLPDAYYRLAPEEHQDVLWACARKFATGPEATSCTIEQMRDVIRQEKLYAGLNEDVSLMPPLRTTSSVVPNSAEEPTVTTQDLLSGLDEEPEEEEEDIQ
jgi:hypothetical protein